VNMDCDCGKMVGGSETAQLCCAGASETKAPDRVYCLNLKDFLGPCRVPTALVGPNIGPDTADMAVLYARVADVHYSGDTSCRRYSRQKGRSDNRTEFCT